MKKIQKILFFIVKIAIIFMTIFIGTFLYNYPKFKIETSSLYTSASEMHIAFGINDVYTMPLCTAITSLLWHNRNPIHIYVMYETLSKENQKKIEEAIKYFPNTNITFLPIYIPEEFKELYNSRLFSKDIFSRINLPNLLPNLDKVLYLDADIIINGNLAPLYNVNLENYEMAAVRDTREDYHLERFKDFQLTDYVFNGVLVMNLKRMRETHATSRIYEFLFQNLGNKTLFLPDQDAMNIILKDSILIVDSIWNADMRQPQSLNAVVLHYPMAKPWNTNHFQGFYWHRYNEITNLIASKSNNYRQMIFHYSCLKVQEPLYMIKFAFEKYVFNPFVNFFAEGIYYILFM